jgi:hypothetical protein
MDKFTIVFIFLLFCLASTFLRFFLVFGYQLFTNDLKLLIKRIKTYFTKK